MNYYELKALLESDIDLNYDKFYKRDLINLIKILIDESKYKKFKNECTVLPGQLSIYDDIKNKI